MGKQGKRDEENCTAREKVDKLKKLTENWTNGATLVAINKEIQDAQTTEERLELLVFKTELLEYALLGKAI